MPKQKTTEAPALLYSEEAETAALGAFLKNPKAIALHGGDLEASDFFLLKHQYIFTAMQACDTVNAVTVTAALKDAGHDLTVGGMEYLLTLVRKAPSPSDAGSYVAIITRISERRRTVDALAKALGDAQDMDQPVEGVIATISDRLRASKSRLEDRGTITAAQGIQSWFDTVEEHATITAQHPYWHLGITTGIKALDDTLDGFRKGGVTLLAGNTGTGKTWFWLASLLHAARAGIERGGTKTGAKVLAFSGEMGEHDLYSRMVGMETGISPLRIYKGHLDAGEMARVIQAASAINELPFKLRLGSRLAIADLERAVQDEKARNGLDAVYLDGVFQLDPKRASAEAFRFTMKAIITGLETIAMEQDVAIFVTHQLSRAALSSETGPELHHLADSADLERSVAVAMALHNPLAHDENPRVERPVELKVLKNRHGPASSMTLTWSAKTYRFAEVVYTRPASTN
jgi:replicative DNA helicase